MITFPFHPCLQLNSIPPTTTVSHLREKLAAARGKCRVDVAFWGGVVPDNVNADGELRRRVQVTQRLVACSAHMLHNFARLRWRAYAASSAS